jgi:hypothetical protein
MSEAAPSPILRISDYGFSLLFFNFFGVGEVVVHPKAI